MHVAWFSWLNLWRKPSCNECGKCCYGPNFKKGFLGKVQKISEYFHKELYKLKDDFPHIIKEVRGLGLLVGIKVIPNQNLFIKETIKNKLLTVRASENVVRLLPPLNVKKEHIDEAIAILRKVCKTFK